MTFKDSMSTTTKSTKYINFKSLEEAHAAAPEGTRFIHRMTVIDDCGTGGFYGFYATPEQEGEYNEGMARMAEWVERH